MERIGDAIDLRLLDDWQRDFPLDPRPFAVIGDAVGCSEAEAIRRICALSETGRITRVGATCAPNTVSASTLAALSVPDDRQEEVAETVGRQPGVNHSYLREDRWNLWFVATGPDRDHVNDVLASIRRETGLTVLDLPLVRPFNVDLGFRLRGKPQRPPVARPVDMSRLRQGDRRILQALTTGMPLCETPFAEIGAALGRGEQDILERVTNLQAAGIISRLGVIVRHRALGWRSNAMVVWDISSERIDRAGPVLAAHPGVTLCYERSPVAGSWPYRLYCMIHAQSRRDALDTLSEASRLPELEGVSFKTLFSNRCFKQTGAMIARQGVAA